jgi:hypothetical protein
MESFDSTLISGMAGPDHGGQVAGNMGNPPPPVKLLPGENKAAVVPDDGASRLNGRGHRNPLKL